MKTAEIRSTFLDYFRSKGHTIVPSSSLVPASDPTLLFTNSGMVQFKNVFLGSEKLPYTRAADVQRCLRAGGKHNDLDSVGYTARHHTFFEMLGNWSFGDYFKRDAIAYAWELLTGVFKLPKEKLWVTVYHTDDEAYDLWNKEVGVPAERIVRIGDNKGAPYASDNFWQMADTGPCGPCTEIFYDHGEDIAGGPPGSPDEDGDRYIEIWNLVFMQFDRAPDGTLSPLPAPCVDTGMGLERLAAVLQHVHSNYEIDLFQHLIKVASELTKTADLGNKSLRVIADHIRACSFLIVDGVLPSNEGRGYVLRRIMRRAIRHGYMLGMRSPFFFELVVPLVEEMGDAYPELAECSSVVMDVIRKEEERFFLTIGRGMTLLARALQDSVPVMRLLALRPEFKGQNYYLDVNTSSGVHLDGEFQSALGSTGVILTQKDVGLRELVLRTLSSIERDGRDTQKLIVVDGPWSTGEAKVADMGVGSKVSIELVQLNDLDLTPHKYLTGDVAFRLYDQDGFPIDLTVDVCRELGFSVDIAGFEDAMKAQQERSREGGRFEAKGQMPAELASQLAPTAFLGYDALSAQGSKVIGIVRAGKQVDQLAHGEEGLVILDRTPFYAESGGQVGDTGALANAGGRFDVADTLKMGGVFFGHAGTWKGSAPLRTGDVVDALVDGVRRQAIVLNHSATHLLHAALRSVLGDHVTQKGSLVAPERLRFDFAHFKPVSREELARIEDLVNAEVRRNAPAEVRHMGYDEAIEFGAMALFGEKYGDEVRVLRMGDFSTELCGGTHVGHTGDIGLFKIVSEAGVASGVRRIEAVTGAGALAHVNDEERRLGELSQLLSTSGDEVVEKLRQLLDKQKKLERELESLRAKAAGSATADLAASAQDIDGIKVVAARLEGLDAKALRDGIDQLKQQWADCVVLLAGAADGRVSLVAGVNGKALGRVKAGEVVAHVASQIDGKGGGRPDMAQGGGSDTPQLPALLAALPQWIRERLNG